MKILKRHLKTLWFEDIDGNKWFPPKNFYMGLMGVPEGFLHQHVLEPCILSHVVYDSKGEIFHGSSTWSQDLALAIAQNGKYSLRESIIIAATACERCMNALAYRYGLKWGYSSNSPRYRKSKTRCEFCERV